MLSLAQSAQKEDAPAKFCGLSAFCETQKTHTTSHRRLLLPSCPRVPRAKISFGTPRRRSTTVACALESAMKNGHLVIARSISLMSRAARGSPGRCRAPHRDATLVRDRSGRRHRVAPEVAARGRYRPRSLARRKARLLPTRKRRPSSRRDAPAMRLNHAARGPALLGCSARRLITRASGGGPHVGRPHFVRDYRRHARVVQLPGSGHRRGLLQRGAPRRRHRRRRRNAGGLQPPVPRRVQDRVRDRDRFIETAPRDAFPYCDANGCVVPESADESNGFGGIIAPPWWDDFRSR